MNNLLIVGNNCKIIVFYRIYLLFND